MAAVSSCARQDAAICELAKIKVGERVRGASQTTKPTPMLPAAMAMVQAQLPWP
jgi:hypothetical protein